MRWVVAFQVNFRSAVHPFSQEFVTNVPRLAGPAEGPDPQLASAKGSPINGARLPHQGDRYRTGPR
jgi:hypothetical protein